jgi:hypothetical protein
MKSSSDEAENATRLDIEPLHIVDEHGHGLVGSREQQQQRHSDGDVVDIADLAETQGMHEYRSRARLHLVEGGQKGCDHLTETAPRECRLFGMAYDSKDPHPPSTSFALGPVENRRLAHTGDPEDLK